MIGKCQKLIGATDQLAAATAAGFAAAAGGAGAASCGARPGRICTCICSSCLACAGAAAGFPAAAGVGESAAGDQSGCHEVFGDACWKENAGKSSLGGLEARENRLVAKPEADGQLEDGRRVVVVVQTCSSIV